MATGSIRKETRYASKTVTSNGSGLINLTEAFGVNANNARGFTVDCQTSHYKCSNVIYWSNGSLYTVLTPYDSGNIQANTSVTIGVTWFPIG